MKSYNFHGQLNKAILDEKITVELIKHAVPLFSDLEHMLGADHKADSYSKQLDAWLEIKEDYYKTKNHFFERISNDLKNSPGGPWQYLEKGVKYYAFNYHEDKEIWIFETQDLVTEFEKWVRRDFIKPNQKKAVAQSGADYKTIGYTIPKGWTDSFVKFKFKY
jgi:hypothetical protein